MFDPVVIVQPPGFAASVLDKLEIGDCGIVIPDFTATPRANVKHMVKDRKPDDHSAFLLY